MAVFNEGTSLIFEGLGIIEDAKAKYYEYKVAIDFKMLFFSSKFGPDENDLLYLTD